MTLKEFLAAPAELPESPSPKGAESDWLFLSEYKVYGHFLQLIQKRFLGDLRGGVIVEAPSGLHTVEGCVMSYAEGRRISRMRIHPCGAECALGHKIDEIYAGEGGLVVSDADALRRALDEDQRGFRAWHKDLINETFQEAGVAYWSGGNMEFPFFEGGFGQDYCPVHVLLSGEKTVGMEIEFIAPGRPYPSQTRW